jgi:hypothetical protein
MLKNADFADVKMKICVFSALRSLRPDPLTRIHVIVLFYRPDCTSIPSDGQVHETPLWRGIRKKNQNRS